MTVHGRTDNAAWRKARVRAIVDAQGQCQLCGGDLDPDAPKNTPMGTEVDHILELAKGGAPYARENLRAVHRWCHQRRDKGQPVQRVPAPKPFDWQNGCPDTHKGQNCFTTEPTRPHSRNW